MKTFTNLNFSLMTNFNSIATIVVATVLMLTSCASEELYISSDNDQNIAVTHEFGFNFIEGDVISVFKINEDKTIIKLELSIDTKYGSIMDYFEIFLGRMVLCQKAAEKLGLQFKLVINEQQLI